MHGPYCARYYDHGMWYLVVQLFQLACKPCVSDTAHVREASQLLTASRSSWTGKTARLTGLHTHSQFTQITQFKPRAVSWWMQLSIASLMPPHHSCGIPSCTTLIPKSICSGPQLLHVLPYGLRCSRNLYAPPVHEAG